MHIVTEVGGKTGYEVSCGGRVVKTTRNTVEAYAYAAGEDRRALNEWFWGKEKDTAEFLEKAIDWLDNHQVNLEQLIVEYGEDTAEAAECIEERNAVVEKLKELNAKMNAIEEASNTNDTGPGF